MCQIRIACRNRWFDRGDLNDDGAKARVIAE
jgi:hypothetical protein